MKIDKETGEAFDLESDPPAGKVPDRVIDELCRCYREAKDYAEALADAVKQQAEKYKIEPAALRKYIAALETDKREKAHKEADDLIRLLDDAA